MASFSNGTEGMDYQYTYCDNCVHGIDNDCPVWNMHLLFAYELTNKKDDPGKVILDELIPMKDDLEPQQCTMFIAKDGNIKKAE